MIKLRPKSSVASVVDGKINFAPFQLSHDLLIWPEGVVAVCPPAASRPTERIQRISTVTGTLPVFDGLSEFIFA